MKIPQEFDTIRPWEPEDLPEVFDRLLSNDQFKQVLAYLYPQVPFEMIAQKLKACKTNLDFQLAFAYDFVHGILKKAATGCEMDCAALIIPATIPSSVTIVISCSIQQSSM